jgi:hypothetical protein
MGIVSVKLARWPLGADAAASIANSDLRSAHRGEAQLRALAIVEDLEPHGAVARDLLAGVRI